MVETHPRKLPNDDKVEIQQQSERRKLKAVVETFEVISL
jgi:hypothetical protein